MKNKAIIPAIMAAAAIFGGLLWCGASPAAREGTPVVFEVKPGDGLRTIARNLESAGLIRSKAAFEALAILGGFAAHLEPGLYRLSPAMPPFVILETLALDGREVSVTIPEGSTVYDIDRILSGALIFRRGDLIAANAAEPSSSPLEGKLFPDTYHFFTDAGADAVVKKLFKNFDAKAGPLLAQDPDRAARNLVIASLIEKEVTSPADRAIVAGILLKRLSSGMPLDIDATICYIKQMQMQKQGCYPLSPADFKIDSPYNTYLHAGLPPAPISNPGTAAIQAAMNPKHSPYWYYLSDPKTGKTIYAVTLEEQNDNRARYLR